MKIAIVTYSHLTSSGSRAPIELARALSAKHVVKVFYKGEQVKRDDGFDVISFHSTLPDFLACQASGLPIVMTYYGTQLNPEYELVSPVASLSVFGLMKNHVKNLLIQTAENYMLRHSRQVVALSRSGCRELEFLYHITAPYVYLGCDHFKNTPPFSPPTAKTRASEKLGGGTKRVHVLSVSRITPYKGFHHLIRMVKNLPVNLIIAGSSPQKEYLKYLQSISTPNVDVQIDVSDIQLAELYAKCDVYVTCDRNLFFGFPPLEAAMFAKPSLALNYCSAPEIILHNKTGFVADDLDKFQSYLKLLIAKPNLRKKMGGAAQVRAKGLFTWDECAKSYINIFGDVVRRSR